MPPRRNPLRPTRIHRALAKRLSGKALVALAIGLAAAPVPAQEALVPSPPADTTVPCDGLTVSSVEVATSRPAFKGGLEWWRRTARFFGLHHQTTSRGLVRRFVSLEPGNRCTEFRRSESERILRAQPFLADATVKTRRVGDGVLVDVATVDEVPVIAGARVSGTSVRAVNLGTLNAFGAGMRFEGRWEDGVTYRNGYGAEVGHNQLFGRPYSVFVDAAKRPLGGHFVAAVNHPFYTDLQKIAWHTGFTQSRDFARLRRPDRTELLQPVDRSMWNVGGVLRFGPPHKLGLIGGMVLGERVVPHHEFRLVDSTTGHSAPTTDTVGVKRFETYDANSVAGVLGVRALTYIRVRGLDALAAEQDVATGAQAGVMLGINPWAEDPLSESFASFDAYAAGQRGRNLVGARLDAESLLDLQKNEWKHMIASGRAAWYVQPKQRWVSEFAIEGAGVWRTIVPFQLELGDRRGGLRGYAASREAGAQRLLARLEQRVDLWRYRETKAAIGAGAFVESGRIWAGDVPFGIATPIRSSAGVAVLAAIPANSQRTLRAEVAMPFTRAHGAKTELRFTIREPWRGFWFEPLGLRWARLSSVPEEIFDWP